MIYEDYVWRSNMTNHAKLWTKQETGQARAFVQQCQGNEDGADFNWVDCAENEGIATSSG